MELKIDPEFEQKIPKLTEEEFAQLEENILSDGEIRDPLVVWNGTILDGHNRYRIYKKHPGLNFKTWDMELPDRNAAIIWICKNQLGRRNLTPEQRDYLIGKQYEAVKASHGHSTGFQMQRDENGRFTVSPQNGDSRFTGKTCQRIAEETNTSKNYVQRAEQFAKEVDAADDVLPGIRDEILSGTIKPTKKDVANIAKAPLEERRELAEQLRQPRARLQEKEKPETITDKEEGEDEEVIEWLDDDDPEEEEVDVEDEEEESEPRYIPTRKEILAVSESMLHSEGVAAATEEDVLCEMTNALETLIWRWNNAGEVYARVLQDKKTQKRIRELALEGMSFFKEIRKGCLWNEKE